MEHFRVGKAVITKITELDMGGVTPDYLFPDVNAEAVRQRAALFADGSFDPATQTLRQSVHTWLVQIEGRTILVDTSVGSDKSRPGAPAFDHLHEPYLERLAQAGVVPDQVDVVLMTHIHLDHVGWNTRHSAGRWIPTFPNATFYFSGIEADYNAAIDAGDDAAASSLRQKAGLGPIEHTPLAGVYTDSVAPIETAKLAHRIDVGNHEAVPGFTYHSFPGHSIDHAVIMLASEGQHALFWGDVLHHPAQVAVEANDWNSVFCEFPEAARASRKKALALAADTGVLVLTTHFPESSAGRVERRGKDYSWTYERGKR